MGGIVCRRQEGLYEGKAVVQGCWSWFQDTLGGDQWHIHWCVCVLDAARRLSCSSRCTCVGVYIADKKCPFTGEVSIRGRILTGRVVSTKMTRTIIIRRDYLHYIPKYSACPSLPTPEYPPLIIFSQTVTRSATRTLPRTSRLHSVSSSAMWSPLASADRSQKRSAST